MKAPEVTAPAGGSILPLAAVLLACAVASLAGIVLSPRTPGIDFWQLRAAPLAVRSGVEGDLYARDGRRAAFEAVALPRLQAVAALGRDVRTLAASGRLGREDLAVLDTVGLNREVLGEETIEVVSSPLLLSVFSLFSRLEYETAYRTWAALSLLLLFGSVHILARLAGHPRATALLVAGALGLVAEPVLAEFRVANVNSVQLAALAGFLALQRRETRAATVASGALLGLAVLFKPNLAAVPLAVALAWAGSRRWRTLALTGAGGALGIAAGVAFSAVVLGSLRFWADWVRVLPELLRSTRTIELGNYSPSRALLEAAGVDLSGVLLVLGLAAVAAVSLLPAPPGASAPARVTAGAQGAEDADCALAAEPTPALRETYLAAGVGVAAMLLSARLVWLHYHVLMLPLAIVLLRPAAVLRRPALAAVAAVALATLTGAMRLLPLLAGAAGAAAIPVAVGLGTLAFFAAGLSELRRTRTAGAAPERPAAAAGATP